MKETSEHCPKTGQTNHRLSCKKSSVRCLPGYRYLIAPRQTTGQHQSALKKIMIF